jgi:hypothetical protein
MYVQDGHTLQTHDDVPKEIREQLYAEEQQSRERNSKSASTSTVSHLLIYINVLPAPSCQTSHLLSCLAETLAKDRPLKYTLIDRLNIHGFQDDAVKEFRPVPYARYTNTKILPLVTTKLLLQDLIKFTKTWFWNFKEVKRLFD